MNKPAYLGLSILEIRKKVIYGFLYDCVKPKYEKKCYDTDSFIIYIKTEHIYLDISKDIETRFDTAHYEFERLLPRGKCKTVLGLMKDELGGKIRDWKKKRDFAALSPKTYGCLTDDNNQNKNWNEQNCAS